MSLNVISRKFYDDQAREVNFLLGNANNLVKAVYRVNVDYTLNLSVSVSVIISGTTLTLTNGTWEDYGFVPGSSLLSVNINGHTATKDILIIDGADMLINSTFSPSIPDDTYTVGTLTCLTKTEGMNVSFNFCRNSLSSEFSLIDGESNRWTVDDLDLLGVGDTKNMTRLGNRSGLPQVNTATIKKISSSPLVFEVTIETYISPFNSNIGFLASESLASFCKFDAMPVFNNLNVVLSRTDKYNGNVGYFNENFNGFTPNFVKESIAWTDADDVPIEAMDYSQPSKFSIRINGTFTSGSKFQFFAFFPSVEPSDFSNLPTDASKNFISTVETAVKAVNTNYTVNTATHSSGATVQFQTVRFEQFTTYAIITGVAVPNADFTDLISSRDTNNRNYRIWVRCENPALDYNSSDMVNVECDNRSLVKTAVPLGTWDENVNFIDHVGNTLELDKDTYTIITEDDVRRESQFILPKGENDFSEIAVISRAKNTTTGEQFELERFAVNLTSLPTLPDGTKPINTIINRPFNIAFPSLMTQVKFERYAPADDENVYGVQVTYPFLSRWEYWLSQLNASNDFFGNKNRNWRTYQNTDWKIENVLALSTDAGQYQNPFVIAIRDYDDANIDYVFEFFKLDGTPITAPLDEVVRIKVTHDVSGVSDCWGQITVEPKENAPRWLISTDYAQIDPAYPLQPLSGETMLKKTIESDRVEFECLFDGRLLDRVKFTSRLQTLAEGGDCANEFARVTYTFEGDEYTVDIPKTGVLNGESAYDSQNEYLFFTGENWDLSSFATSTDLENWTSSEWSGISVEFIELEANCLVLNVNGQSYTIYQNSEFTYRYDSDVLVVIISINTGEMTITGFGDSFEYSLSSPLDPPISDEWIGEGLENVSTTACDCEGSLSQSHRVKEEYKVAKVPKSFTPENRGFRDCGCVPFLTLVDPTDTARHRNDVNSAWGQGEDVSFELKKNGVTTNYTPIVTPFPNETDAFYTTIEWRDVHALDGVGCYELYITETYAGLTNTRVWGKYQLAVYSTNLAQGTVRLLSYFNDVNSSIGINFTGAFVKDTLRLKAKFGYWNPLTEVDNIQYTDAERMKVKREDVTEYELRVDFHTECYIERLRFHLLSENACYVTDHNADNYTYRYIDYPVIVKEGFTPEWFDGTRAVKGVVKFHDKQKLTRTHFQDNENAGNFLPPTDAFLPAQIVDGSEIVQVGSGQSYTCQGGSSEITVSNFNDTYAVTTSVDFELPNTTVNVFVDGMLSGTGSIVTLDPTEEINVLWT
jgi:hypothetical protein